MNCKANDNAIWICIKINNLGITYFLKEKEYYWYENDYLKFYLILNSKKSD